MKVSELIGMLQKLPPDSDVEVACYEPEDMSDRTYYPTHAIELDGEVVIWCMKQGYTEEEAIRQLIEHVKVEGVNRSQLEEFLKVELDDDPKSP